MEPYPNKHHVDSMLHLRLYARYLRCIPPASPTLLASSCDNLNLTDLHKPWKSQVSDQSNDGIVLDDRVLDDDHDAIFDDKAFAFPVALSHAFLVDDLDVRADSGILVNDALPHSAARPCRSQCPRVF